jgi:uncharacterized protein
VTELDGVEVLSERQCRSLLGREQVGRVAVSENARVAVFPVNYSVVSDEIAFFTAREPSCGRAAANSRVTFEVDHLDPFAQTGWSVMVVGVTREVTEPVVVAGTRASGLRPWAVGDRGHLIALSTEAISGRRVGGAAGRRERGHLPNLAMVGPHLPVSAVRMHRCGSARGRRCKRRPTPCAMPTCRSCWSSPIPRSSLSEI